MLALTIASGMLLLGSGKRRIYTHTYANSDEEGLEPQTGSRSRNPKRTKNMAANMYAIDVWKLAGQNSVHYSDHIPVGNFDRSQPKTKTSGRMVTCNIAQNIQNNKVDGTEAESVQRCQKDHKRDARGDARGCTVKFFQDMKTYDVDIVCLQETVPQHTELLFKEVFPYGYAIEFGTIEYGHHDNKCVGIMYKRTNFKTIKYEPLLDLGLYGNKKIRGCLGLFFPQNNHLVLSMWLGHGVKPETFQKMLNSIADDFDDRCYPRPKRITIGMDSNDSKGKFLKQNDFVFLGHTIRVGSFQPYKGEGHPQNQNTCCGAQPGKIILTGDYILDSKN